MPVRGITLITTVRLIANHRPVVGGVRGAVVKVVVDGVARVRGIQLYRFTHQTNPIHQFSLKT